MPYPYSGREMVTRLIRAGTTTAVIDGLFSSVLSVAFYGSTVTALWQRVASTLVGPDAMNRGMQTVAIGILMHVGVAFAWSAVFLFVAMRSGWIREVLASSFGAVKIGAMYGPVIWVVMSLAVIPLLTHTDPKITFRWWVQFVAHFPFVGLPISLAARMTPESVISR